MFYCDVPDTAFVFQLFQHDLLLAGKKCDVIAAVDKYVKDSFLFPPGQWDLDYLKPATEEITQLSAQRHVLRTKTVKTPPRNRKKSYAFQQPLIPAVETFQPRKPSRPSGLPLRRDTVVSEDDIRSFLNGRFCIAGNFHCVDQSAFACSYICVPLCVCKWFAYVFSLVLCVSADMHLLCTRTCPYVCGSTCVQAGGCAGK